jgi:acetoin utilization deacetylase AcuC-like enzyme
VDDDAYLGALQTHLPVLTKDFRPDIVFYLAGVDVAEGDRYGKFHLSEAGIRARERCVLDWTRKLGVPLVITLAGGYSPNAVQTAILHSIVFEEAINS